MLVKGVAKHSLSSTKPVPSPAPHQVHLSEVQDAPAAEALALAVHSLMQTACIKQPHACNACSHTVLS